MESSVRTESLQGNPQFRSGATVTRRTSLPSESSKARPARKTSFPYFTTLDTTAVLCKALQVTPTAHAKSRRFRDFRPPTCEGEIRNHRGTRTTDARHLTRACLTGSFRTHLTGHRLARARPLRCCGASSKESFRHTRTASGSRHWPWQWVNRK